MGREEPAEEFLSFCKRKGQVYFLIIGISQNPQIWRTIREGEAPEGPP